MTGNTGAKGGTTPGVAGPIGPTGERGAQGPPGAIGAQGRVGGMDCWTTYRDFWFQADLAEIDKADFYKVSDIAVYMQKNPSIQVGIDGTLDSRNSDKRSRDLSDRRVKSIRTALIEAGVPADRIKTGAFGDVQLRRDHRVEVLLVTAN